MSNTYTDIHSIIYNRARPICKGKISKSQPYSDENIISYICNNDDSPIVKDYAEYEYELCIYKNVASNSYYIYQEDFLIKDENSGIIYRIYKNIYKNNDYCKFQIRADNHYWHVNHEYIDSFNFDKNKILNRLKTIILFS